jgi:hypothetical protein
MEFLRSLCVLNLKNGGSGFAPAIRRNPSCAFSPGVSSAPISASPLLRGEIAASDHVILARCLKAGAGEHWPSLENGAIARALAPNCGRDRGAVAAAFRPWDVPSARHGAYPEKSGKATASSL